MIQFLEVQMELARPYPIDRNADTLKIHARMTTDQCTYETCHDVPIRLILGAKSLFDIIWDDMGKSIKRELAKTEPQVLNSNVAGEEG